MLMVTPVISNRLQVFCDVNFSACVINMLTCKQSVFGVGMYAKVGFNITYYSLDH